LTSSKKTHLSKGLFISALFVGYFKDVMPETGVKKITLGNKKPRGNPVVFEEGRLRACLTIIRNFSHAAYMPLFDKP
jgi:hypothetical protein